MGLCVYFDQLALNLSNEVSFLLLNPEPTEACINLGVVSEWFVTFSSLWRNLGGRLLSGFSPFVV